MAGSLLVLAAGFALWGCDEDDGDDGRNSAGASAGTNGSPAAGAGAGAGGSAGGAGAGAGAAAQGGSPAPAESDAKLGFERPQGSEHFVFTANADTGRLAVIAADTLAIETLEVGDRPVIVHTLPGSDDAIVLNAGSDDVAIVRAAGRAARISRVAVTPGSNALRAAPDGRHAVAYFDAAAALAGGEQGSLQSVSVVSLVEGADEAVEVSVGFRPRGVYFAQDGSVAYVATDEGLSRIELSAVANDGAPGARTIALGEDARSHELALTPDGRHALTRRPGSSEIQLFDLEQATSTGLDLAALVPVEPSSGQDDAGTPPPDAVEVTDLELAASGEFALAVVRSRSTVLRIPVPSAFESPARVRAYTLPELVFGSATVSPDGKHALLYTTASPVELITVLDLEGEAPPRPVLLRKAVESVAFAPDGESALIVHRKADGELDEPGLDADTRLDRSFAYSVLRVADAEVKLQVTPVAPRTFTIVPDSGCLFVLLRDDARGLRELQKVDTRSLQLRSFPLTSPPLSLGAVPGSARVFVNQARSDGRISFIDWRDDEVHTLTGFELNSRIRN